MSTSTPEQAAMGAAVAAVRKVLATAKNPRTVLGQGNPTAVAFAAAWAAISVWRETIAHERARGSGGICTECGRIPDPEPPAAKMRP